MTPKAVLQEIERAESRIRPHTLSTPLIESKPLSKLIGGKVLLKLESEQHTGSFKARGSMNKILSLSAEEKERGIITASTGNHALGCARALEVTGTKGTIYLPVHAAKSKVEALRGYSANLEFYATNPLETELHAKSLARANSQVWISPYDDPCIIGGQGTIGIELCRQQEHFDHVLICIGGGGLMSGVGSYLRHHRPDTKIVGCLPENSPEMKLSLDKGEVVVLDSYRETLSDGSAGGLEPDSITFPICREVVDECLLVSEPEIAEGIRFAAHHHHKIIEGAAAVTIAALKRYRERFAGATVVLVICGANIDVAKLKTLL